MPLPAHRRNLSIATQLVISTWLQSFPPLNDINGRHPGRNPVRGTFMSTNPEYGSQEHNKPKHNGVEGENVLFSPAEQEARQRLGKPPPLHPIFERLSQALAKQQEAARSGKPHSRDVPPSHNQGEVAENPVLSKPPGSAELDRQERRRAYKREWIRRWRKKHPEQNRERNREAGRRYQRTERGREHRRVYLRDYRRRKRNQRSSGN